MRKILLGIFLTSTCFAQYTPTPNIGLQIPSNGSTNWNLPLNYNFNRLDLLLSGGATIPGLSVSGNVTVTGSVTAGSFTGVEGGTFPTISGTPISNQCAVWATSTTIKGQTCASTTGVVSINSVTGAFTFSGSGVTCSATTCTFNSSGSSVGPQGAIQVAGSTSGSFDSGTPSQLVTALSTSNGSEWYGDSTPCATGATATVSGNVSRSINQNGYVGLMMPILGGDLANYCYPATTQIDINNFTFDHANNRGVGSPTYFGEGFINDANNTNATNINYQSSAKYGLQGQILFRVIPRANKVFAQDAGVTISGTWTSDTSHQSGWGRASTVNGSTFSCPAVVGSDGHMVIWALQQDGNGGTWTGAIAGVPITDPVTSSTTFTAAGYGGIPISGLTYNSQYVAYVYSGLSPGTRTFQATVTSSTGAGNIVDFGGCAGLPSTSVNLPWDFEAGVPFQNSGTGGSADATTAAYDSIVSTLVSNLSALSLNVGFVDVRNTLLNAPACGNGTEATMFTNCYADNKHLNNLGYATEVNATTGYAAVVTTANPFLTAGALKNPRQGPMNVYPFSAAPSDTSHWWTPNGLVANTPGFGITFTCANAGLNCSGIGSLANYGLSAIMAGANFNVINCPGFVTYTNASNCTQFISTQANGALCFFGSSGGCSGNPFYYFTNGVADIGGLAGYNQTGVWLTAPFSGVSTSSPATSGVNQSSNSFTIRGNFWTGTANSPADLYLLNVLGTGNNPSMTLTLLGGYSTGPYGVNFSAATQTNLLGNMSALSIGATNPGTGAFTTLTKGGNNVCDVNGGGCPIPTVFGRTGAITATSGDYTVSQITGAAALASPAFTGSPTKNGNDLCDVTGSGCPSSGVASFNSRTGAVTSASGDYTVSQITGAAALASPAFTGSPTIGGNAICQSTGTNCPASITLGGTPTSSNVHLGTGAGTGATLVGITGYDASFGIQITTGTTPATAAEIFTVTFTTSRGHSAYCMIYPQGQSAYTSFSQMPSLSGSSPTSVQASSGTAALPASTTLTFSVFCP